MAIDSRIKKVLIIGSGPIVIGQACEFDYSGTQACKALMKEGLEVVLVNSNPATIMTDPEIATRVYVEPLKVPYLEKIIEIEKPDAVIPTLGGQTALNLALELHSKGILQKHKVQLLAATPEVIKAGEDREIFRNLLDKIGARAPKSHLVRTYEHGLNVADDLGYPLILRPNYTLGGGGGGVAYSPEEYKKMLVTALHESPTSEVLVEESILGWKEFELEVMRDNRGEFKVICSIENLDPCGVHTGDSITVAPQLTLDEQEYREMRDEAQKIIEIVGMKAGGANIQFAVHPTTKERVVIEMNPRVSRSSALASKATGVPIAKISALLAVGYNFDEITQDISKGVPAILEPELDYIVTKIPRFAFEKFPGAKDFLTTQMKSVGEVMALGKTLQESLMKAISSLEMNPQGIPVVEFETGKVSYPNSQRIYQLFQAFREGKTVAEVEELTMINPVFLNAIEEIISFEKDFANSFSTGNSDLLLKAKQLGFSDARLAKLLNTFETDIRALREKANILPKYVPVGEKRSATDTCAPYYYSTYAAVNSVSIQAPESVLIIGSGPNRIGQGIEFDYSCVRGVKALRASGKNVLMVNSNPETVSTDYDTSDALFFEPLTFESVNEVMRFMKPQGFVAQLGGQTPIGLAPELVKEGYHLMGSSLEAIDLAEDRGLFSKICKELNFAIPNSAMAGSLIEALQYEEKVGYPMICRPSYVLGGRRMEVIESRDELISYFQRHADFIALDKPCLMDQFLAGALEVDVDLVRGKDWTVVGGVVEHIEAAGIHSGDSMGVIPPQRLRPEASERIEELSRKLAERIDVIGHLNLQLAVKSDVVYMLEANPRSSRSVPFVAKATGIPLIDLGVAAMLGKTKTDLQLDNLNWKDLDTVAVKGVVFPFKKFSESDSILGPEMKSTGESMGRGKTYSEALAKAFQSCNIKLPKMGQVFFSLRDKDKASMLPMAKDLQRMGYGVSATTGTANFFNEHGVNCLALKKVDEGRPHCVDKIRSGEVAFVINTTSGKRAIEASFDIRRACTDYNIPCLTESDAAEAFVLALKNAENESSSVSALYQMKEF
ncbi:carbamoyl-phosphate synthase [Bdellovibrio bacteriovorus W]|nr:carbamoyl-phosphate synthase [Bdellovibrio bacteriovorus W]